MLNRKNILEVQDISKPERKIPEKEILWPVQQGYSFDNTINNDSSCFPNLEAIVLRNSINERAHPLNSFGKAISNAFERIWIIDPYFLNPDKGTQNDRIDIIINWLIHPEMLASDIKILTTNHGNDEKINNEIVEKFKDFEVLINNERLNSKKGDGCNIEILFTLTKNFNYIHDRFAIIDNELWHFGATVGGFHSSVNAATRGWNASDHGAIEFFELVWNKCKLGSKT